MAMYECEMGGIELIDSKFGTTSATGSAQQLDAKILSLNWDSIQQQYRYILMVPYHYNANEALDNNYIPSCSMIYPTSIKNYPPNGSTYIQGMYPDLSGFTKIIQIRIDSDKSARVSLYINNSTAQKVGWKLYGIK